MPALVYRIIEVLSALVLDLPIGTNLSMFHLLWTLISGRLLTQRGAIIPALADAGLDPAVVRRAWAALGQGSWDIATLLTAFGRLVRREGRWKPRFHGGYRAFSLDTAGFLRPRLVDCETKHYWSLAGKAVPAVAFGLVTEIGQVDDYRLPVLHTVVRAPTAAATEITLIGHLLHQTAQILPPAAVSVTDRGFPLAQLLAAKMPRWVTRVPANFTARQATPSPYGGRGRPPTRGCIVRPLARRYKGKVLPATPPDHTENFQCGARWVRAEVWSNLCHAQPTLRQCHFQCVAFHDPAFKTPLLAATNLPLTPTALATFYVAQWPELHMQPAAPLTPPALAATYRDRWPVEQIPLAAKQLIGAARQFVFAPETRHRLPELALLAGNVLMYLAATQPAHPTGFWDRCPRPTAGRLRRVLQRLSFSQDWPLPASLRKKNSITDHLPKGIRAHRRSAQPIPAQT